MNQTKSLFEGVEGYIHKLYFDEYRKTKPVNFCSKEYQTYVKTQSAIQNKGYDKLLGTIKESANTLKKIKRGLSLFDQKEYLRSRESKSIPIFDDPKVREKLENVID